MAKEQTPDWEEKLKTYLATHGLRLTNQRREIARAFFAQEGHPNIEELYSSLRRKQPSIGQATVYRTLKLLVESGLATQARFGGTSTRYEAANTKEHHDHLICSICGCIIEFQNEKIEAAQRQVAESFGFALVDHTMELFGICREYQATGKVCEGRLTQTF